MASQTAVVRQMETRNGPRRQSASNRGTEKEGQSREQNKLRQTIAQQSTEIKNLTARLATLTEREKDLRGMLLDAHDQLLRRDEEIFATAMPSLNSAGASARQQQVVKGRFLPYQQLLHEIRRLVAEALPNSGDIAVVSKGDDQLLQLRPCHGRHFPQTADGTYLGHHPANDAAAIGQLEDLRKRGAQFLLLPQTSLWWLDHYTEFTSYLNRHFQRVIDEREVCVMYKLGHTDGSVQRDAATLPAAPGAKPFGFNVAGHVTSEKGVGEGLRSTVRSLQAANLPITLNNFIDAGSLNRETEGVILGTDNPYGINLLHMNADEVPEFRSLKGEEYFKDRYNIGYWAWELSTFPERWNSSFDHVHELWVPSNFVLDSVSRASPVPVIRVPHSLPEALTMVSGGRARFGWPENKYIFLFMFDFMSVIERKNPFGLIESFKKAFSSNEDVLLVLKSSHSSFAPKARLALENAIRGTNIRLMDCVLSKAETNSLLDAADCYVSLHRSEGFGLTMAEAMCLGKPVIGTAYSGNMDFMNSSNSFPVHYRLTTIGRGHDPYDRGAVWADPDLSHAANLMRFVFDNRQAASAIAREGQRSIRRALHPSVIGDLVSQRLTRLAAIGKIGIPEDFAERVQNGRRRGVQDDGYAELVDEAREFTEKHTPAGARVAIISKGDDNFTRLQARQGWHFPSQPDGVYLGHHPADSAGAIGLLEMIHARGAEFLLIPQSASWWFDYYPEFKEYLDSQYQRIGEHHSARLYQLSRPSTVNGPIVVRKEARRARLDRKTALTPRATPERL